MKHLLIITGFIISIILLCIVCGVLTYVPERELRETFDTILFVFRWLVLGVAGVVALAVGLSAIVATGFGLYWVGCVAYANVSMWFFNRKIKEAEALKAKREAGIMVTVAPPGSQVFTYVMQELKDALTVIPSHLLPTTTNGVYIPPSPGDIGRWQFFQLSQSISRKPDTAMQMPEPLMIEAPLPDYVDLADHIAGDTTSLRNVFLGVGKFPDGQVRPVRAPLGRLVHIAQGGSSGFGKSTSMLSLAYQAVNAKEHPKVLMIDAQAVTFTPFDGHASLLHPLVSEPKDVLSVLNGLLGEMKRRQELFSHWRGVSKLSQYNEVVSPDERLPEIPVFFDEFGLLADDKKIAQAVTTLSRGCRKAGIYFIASAQTWKGDEISTAIRANLSTTIQFYARDKAQSRVLLGSSVAADITIPGRAYCILPGQHGLIELQTPIVGSVIDVEPVLIEDSERVVFEAPEIEPTEQEQEILDLWDSNWEKKDICIEVFGSVGGNQYKKIDSILERFGRV